MFDVHQGVARIHYDYTTKRFAMFHEGNELEPGVPPYHFKYELVENFDLVSWNDTSFLQTVFLTEGLSPLLVYAVLSNCIFISFKNIRYFVDADTCTMSNIFEAMGGPCVPGNHNMQLPSTFI